MKKIVNLLGNEELEKSIEVANYYRTILTQKTKQTNKVIF